MKRLPLGLGVLRPLLLGMLAGGLATGLVVPDLVRQREAVKARRLREEKARQSWQAFATEADRLLHHLDGRGACLCYTKVDENGWSATSILTSLQLRELVNAPENELVFPVFPTVYTPNNADKVYYDAILGSEIERGDKVLVIGAGSGADAWVAWLKSHSLIYVIEVNPMAIANVHATARLGGFPVKTVLGDIRDMTFPEEYGNFDFVLWNMPFLDDAIIEEQRFHDGDDGSILARFLTLLPSLLKKNGQAIVLNYAEARRCIDGRNVTVRRHGGVTVYIISNRG